MYSWFTITNIVCSRFSSFLRSFLLLISINLLSLTFVFLFVFLYVGFDLVDFDLVDFDLVSLILHWVFLVDFVLVFKNFFILVIFLVNL